MKTHLALIVGAALAAGSASTAYAGHHHDVVGVYYNRYLHRPIDHRGLRSWTRVLNCDGPVAVQAGILGSDEYFRSHGNCPNSFVIALYQDVLGRRPCAAEIDPWVCQLGKCGCRVTLARSFLVAAQAELDGCHRQHRHGWRR